MNEAVEHGQRRLRYGGIPITNSAQLIERAAYKWGYEEGVKSMSSLTEHYAWEASVSSIQRLSAEDRELMFGALFKKICRDCYDDLNWNEELGRPKDCYCTNDE